MIKIIILILSFGSSTLLTLLQHFAEPWKIVLWIVGFGLLFILGLAILFFLIVGVFVIGGKRKDIPIKYKGIYRFVYNRYQSFLLSLLSVKLTINGLDKVPKNTNFILLQNHVSNVDPIFTDYVFRKFPMIFVSKDSLFKIPFFGKLVHHIGYIKLTRKTGMDDANEIVRALRWIKSNQCSLCVYPEGTRNKKFPNPELLEYKDGCISFVKKMNRPIVISVIHGSDKINEKKLFKIHKIQIDVLKVIDPEEYQKLSQEELSNFIRNTMLEGIKNPLTSKEKVWQY